MPTTRKAVASRKPKPKKKAKRRAAVTTEHLAPGRIKLTPEVAETIINATRAGVYVETAANAAGIRDETLQSWVRTAATAEKRHRSGKKLTPDEGIYRQFGSDLFKAWAQFEIDAALIINESGKTSWQAMAWRLERAMPHKYAAAPLGRRHTKFDALARIYESELYESSQTLAQTATNANTEREVAEMAKLYDLAMKRFEEHSEPVWLEKALEIHDRRMRLLGLYAPTKVAPTDPSGQNPYAGYTAEELDRELKHYLTPDTGSPAKGSA